MARNFQEEIENRENILQSTFDNMDEIRESFINESIEFLKPFWSQQAQLIAKNEPE
jgi:hypothetical protein